MSVNDTNADPAAYPDAVLAAALLSQRDVSATIPVNLVTHPAVTLQSACFSSSRYEDVAAQKCLANLLATGFRRIILDIYWNALLAQWSLCPVAVPTYLAATAETQSATSRSSPTTTTRLSASQLRGTIHTTTSSGIIIRRQETAREFATEATQTSPTTVAPPAATGVSGVPGLYQLGTYQCTPSLTFEIVLSAFQRHFEQTSTDVNATLRYLVVNLHAATILPTDGGDGSDLPLPSSQPLSQILNDTLGPTLYTPQILQTERANLNTTWLASTTLVASDYLRYGVGSANLASTTTGWPSEGYVELDSAKRLLVGYGVRDLASTQYDTTNDSSVIFSPQDLTSTISPTFSGNGTVTAGCLFTADSPPVNSSYAIASIPTTLSNNETSHAASSLSQCGISPLLNRTLADSAATDVQPYTSFVSASLWSWAPGQPAVMRVEDSARCAALNLASNTAVGGSWTVIDCGTSLPGACRLNGLPYNWTLTRQSGDYNSVNRVCPGGSAFAVPRTALENTALRAAAVKALNPSGQSSLTGNAAMMWLNLNDLDVQSCWVTGVQAQCPYSQPVVEGRQVVVPVVAAVIVLVLAALTVFVKYAANRRKVRRGRSEKGVRGVGGKGVVGDYDGVPS